MSRKLEVLIIGIITFLGYGVVVTGGIVSAANMLKNAAEAENIDKENVDDHGDTTFTNAFSKSGISPPKQLTAMIDGAKETIDVAVYVIAKTAIVTHLCSASRRGVRVRIIADKIDDYQEDALAELLHAGISIKMNSYEGRMHVKNMIIDRKFVASGSCNLTNHAEKQNEDMSIIAGNSSVAGEWSDKFGEMWNDAIYYVSYRIKGVSRLA